MGCFGIEDIFLGSLLRFLLGLVLRCPMILRLETGQLFGGGGGGKFALFPTECNISRTQIYLPEIQYNYHCFLKDDSLS